MKQTFVFSGSGGQGIMSAGITLAQTAIAMGRHATYLPEYGPEQRGGSAKCTVVISDDPIVSPLPRRCDVLVTMNEQSFRKFGEDLKDDGVLLANSCLVKSAEPRDEITLISAAVDDVALEVGNPKTANVVLLGILIGATDVVRLDVFEESLKVKFGAKSPEVLEMNMRALAKGYEIGRQYKK